MDGVEPGTQLIEGRSCETTGLGGLPSQRHLVPEPGIGGHGDYVWEQGSFADPPAHGLQTWFIRGGSAGAAIYKFRQPGVYAYLTHNLIEAVELGALAHVVVDGEWDDDLMTQVQAPAPISA